MTSGEGPGSRRRLVLEAGSLVAFVLVVLWGAWRCEDIAIRGDDGYYFYAGHRLLHGNVEHWHLAWAPLFVALNAVASLVPTGSLHTIDLLTLVLALATTLALWWAIRPFVHPVAALLGAAWWAAHWYDRVSTLHVFPWGMLLWTLGCACFLRRRYVSAALLMAMGAVDRPDTVVWLAVLAFAVVLVGDRLEGLGRGAKIAFVLAIGALAAVWAIDTHRPHRAWMAFGQHYALSVHERGGGRNPVDGEELDPWRDFQEVVRAGFGDADTTLDAYRANPEELGAHLSYNLGQFPDGFRRLMLRPFAWVPRLSDCLVVMLAVLVAGSLVRCRGRPGRLTAALPRGAWLLLATGVTCFLPWLLLHPRPELALPLAAPLYLLVARLAFLRPETTSGEAAGPWWAGPAVVLGAAALVPGLCEGRGPLGVRLPVRASVAAVAPHADEIHGDLVAVGAMGLKFLAAIDGAEPVELTSPEVEAGGPRALAALGRLLDEHPRAHVLLSRRHVRDKEFASSGASLLEQRGWRLLNREDDVVLYAPPEPER